MIRFSFGRESRQLPERHLLHFITTHQPMLIIFDPKIMPVLSVFKYGYVKAYA